MLSGEFLSGFAGMIKVPGTEAANSATYGKRGRDPRKRWPAMAEGVFHNPRAAGGAHSQSDGST